MRVLVQKWQSTFLVLIHVRAIAFASLCMLCYRYFSVLSSAKPLDILHKTSRSRPSPLNSTVASHPSAGRDNYFDPLRSPPSSSCSGHLWSGFYSSSASSFGGGRQRSQGPDGLGREAPYQKGCPNDPGGPLHPEECRTSSSTFRWPDSCWWFVPPWAWTYFGNHRAAVIGPKATPASKGESLG